MSEIRVELVGHRFDTRLSGIARYTRELHHHLKRRATVSMTEQFYLPLARHIDPLHYFPIGVSQHRKGSIVHFLEDFGCAQMFWNPMRPAVATSHDLGFLAWQPEAKMHHTLDRILLHLSYLGLKRMDAVVTVSEYSRQTVIQRLRIPAEKVVSIHSGIDSDFFKPIPNARAKLAEQHGFADDSKIKYLLYVGAEFPRKNLEMIFQVLKRLPQNVRLIKVGIPGGERFRKDTQRIIAELELQDRVFLLGQVRDEDLPLLYSAADVYICASFLEGFGHPILEAMACGTPVVCSNTSSLPEITGDAAILVPPSDLEAMTEAVHTVMRDQALRECMRTRGLRQAANFSWDETAKGVAQVYRRITATVA